MVFSVSFDIANRGANSVKLRRNEFAAVAPLRAAKSARARNLSGSEMRPHQKR
jgi:hypothetical protein